MVLHLNKFECPSPEDAFCQIWLKLAQWFLIRRILNFAKVFYYFIIISPWKNAGSFICRSLNFLHSRMLWTTFVWYSLSGSGEKVFVNVFSLLQYDLPLEKCGALNMNKLEFPSPNDAFWQVCMKFARWFRRSHCIFAIL